MFLVIAKECDCKVFRARESGANLRILLKNLSFMSMEYFRFNTLIGCLVKIVSHPLGTVAF